MLPTFDETKNDMQLPDSITSFLQEPYSLSQEQIDFYDQNRYIKLKQVLNNESLEFFNEAITKRVDQMTTSLFPKLS